MVVLDGGTFLMGAEEPEGYPEQGEGPVREVEVAPFLLSATAVTNEEFAAFVLATGHVTDAERLGGSEVFPGRLRPIPPVAMVPGDAPWWRWVPLASWSAPEGPGSTWKDRPDHPVVHVSWNDASRYAHWRHQRLPTEAEWEFAARGGLVQQRYPWGSVLEPGGERRMNIWPGAEFVVSDQAGTCPVDAFPPNAFGLHNMTGNVWEWTSDRFDATKRVARGGSYLCHHSWSRRYRVAARGAAVPETSTGDIGFRCASRAATPSG